MGEGQAAVTGPPPHTEDSPMGKDCPTWMAVVLRLGGPGLPCNLHHSSVTARAPLTDSPSLSHRGTHARRRSGLQNRSGAELLAQSPCGSWAGPGTPRSGPHNTKPGPEPERAKF